MTTDDDSTKSEKDQLLQLPHRTSVAHRKALRTLEDEEGWTKAGGAYAEFFSPREDIWDIYKQGKWAEDHWIVDGLIRSGSNCLIVGDSNVGKTFMAMELGISIVSGELFLQHFDCDRGPVIYTGGEGDKDLLVRRIHNVALGKHLNPEEFMQQYRRTFLLSLPPDFAARYPMPLANKDYQSHLMEMILHWDKRYRPRAFVWDPLSALIPDVDHDPSVIQEVVNFLKELNKKCDSASFLLHHPKKKQANGPTSRRDLIRGESSWVNFCDDVICIEGDDEDPGLIHFWGNKSRDGVASGDAESMFGAKRNFENVDTERYFPSASPGALQKIQFTYVPHKRKATKKQEKGRGGRETDVQVAPQNSAVQQAKSQILQVMNSTSQALDRNALKRAVGLDPYEKSEKADMFNEAVQQLTNEDRIAHYIPSGGVRPLYVPTVPTKAVGDPQQPDEETRRTS